MATNDRAHEKVGLKLLQLTYAEDDKGISFAVWRHSHYFIWLVRYIAYPV